MDRLQKADDSILKQKETTNELLPLETKKVNNNKKKKIGDALCDVCNPQVSLPTEFKAFHIQTRAGDVEKCTPSV